jgi:serine/threonine-protein kinase RsbW
VEAQRLPGNLSSLSVARDYVRAVTHEACISEQAAYNLMLAVDELITNIVTHGYEEEGRKGDVVLSASMTDEEVIITLEDTGVPFDPKTRKQPGQEELHRPLAERPIGGLGIFLAAQNLDRFEYRFEDGENHNILGILRTNET